MREKAGEDIGKVGKEGDNGGEEMKRMAAREKYREKKGGWRLEGGGGKEPGMGAVEMEKRSGRKSWSQCK